MNKQNLPVILLAILSVLLIIAYFNKNNLNEFIADKMRESTGAENILSGQQWVDSLFNYSENHENYEFTLIQFKSGGCAICRQMEPELQKIRNNSLHVNIAIMNVMNPNSVAVMKYFGVSAVPMHIILDKRGNEIFRKYGYIPAEELADNFIE